MNRTNAPPKNDEPRGLAGGAGLETQTTGNSTDSATSDGTRYAIVCIGCGLLEITTRRGTLTCSAACRVRAHRNGSAAALRDLAARFKLPPDLLLQARAAQELSPTIAEAVRAGTAELEDVQPQLCALLDRRATKQALGVTL